MKTFPVAFAVALALGLTASARADSPRCSSSAAQGALSIEQAVTKAEALGYAVKEVKRSKGCWKVEGFDRNGAEIEIRFDPGSGAVVKPRNWRPPANG